MGWSGRKLVRRYLLGRYLPAAPPPGWAAEQLLPRITTETDRSPTVPTETDDGELTRLLCEAEPTIRLAVTGYDPLASPRASYVG